MRKLTLEEFKNRASILHNYKYDYSLITEYTNNKKSIEIICNCGNIFPQRIVDHLNGHGCSICNNFLKYDNITFINKATYVHNNRYSYINTNYKKSDIDILITCSIHGDFKQKPYSHLQGHGCDKCEGQVKHSNEEFILKTTIIWKNRWIYDNTFYNGMDKFITITCPYHGDFKQKSYDHIKGHIGCKKCEVKSLGEDKIKNFLEEINILYMKEYSFSDCKYKNKLKFDFYLPDYNLCIEFDGIHHFKAVKYFGGMKKLTETKLRDEIKTQYCKNNNIKLLRIKYDEDIDKILKINLITTELYNL